MGALLANLDDDFEKLAQNLELYDDFSPGRTTCDFLSPVKFGQAVVELVNSRVCNWTFADNDSGAWQSSCGELWSFFDGGPLENRVTYCHHCGGKVVLPVIE